MTSHAIEEPDYEVKARIDGVEIRQYPAYVVAEVELAGSAAKSGNEGFRILAGYIFGKNKAGSKLAMTAPVTQTVSSKTLVTSMAPADPGGGYRIQFVLPKGVSSDTAPIPVDQRIVVRQVQPMRMAVIRYSGFWSDANYMEHLTLLQQTLSKAGVKWSGEPVYARYNPPFTPWFMRRNEIWLQVPGG